MMGQKESGQPARSRKAAGRGKLQESDLPTPDADLLADELLSQSQHAVENEASAISAGSGKGAAEVEFSGGMPVIGPANDENERMLIDRIIAGDRSALAELFTLYQPRLWRLVSFRLHPKLRGRIDPDDVLQDAWMRAVERVDYFLRDASQSCFIWFRIIVSQTLIDLHRFHIGASKRNAAREMSMTGRWNSESTSTSLAAHLQGRLSSPSAALARVETAQQVDAVLQGMDELDREVLALRHFEGLTNHETALVLEMTEQAASARYVRALRRLKQILTVSPSLFGEWKPRG